MTSGAKVILALLGGTLAVSVIAVGAFFLTDEPRLLCVEGELQDNPLGPDGRFMPRAETFATVGEAEAFVCRRIPHPRDTGGLSVTAVQVTRTTNLGKLVEGEGRATVSILYARAQDSEPVATFQIAFPAVGQSEGGPSSQPVTVAGREATLVPTANGVAVFWNSGGFGFSGEVLQADVVSSAELLALLDSVR